MEFIRELYYGEIFPCEKGFYANKKYVSAMKNMSKSREQLTEILNEEGIKLFEEFWEDESKFVGEIEFESFKQGFSLAVQMMCDCFCEDNK